MLCNVSVFFRHEIKDDGSLEIRNVHIQDAGNYHCVVKKDHGVYQEAATLRIGGKLFMSFS